jgi:hypothetical protein
MPWMQLATYVTVFCLGYFLWLNSNILHNEPNCRAPILTCDKYESSLRHIHDPVLSSLKMKERYTFTFFLIFVLYELNGLYCTRLFLVPVIQFSDYLATQHPEKVRIFVRFKWKRLLERGEELRVIYRENPLNLNRKEGFLSFVKISMH